jgi:hypothetical protein
LCGAIINRTRVFLEDPELAKAREVEPDISSEGDYYEEMGIGGRFGRRSGASRN